MKAVKKNEADKETPKKALSDQAFDKFKELIVECELEEDWLEMLESIDSLDSDMDPLRQLADFKADDQSKNNTS